MAKTFFKILIFLVFSFCFSQILSAQTKEELKSNETFLRESIQELLKKTFTDFPQGSPELVFIDPESDSPANWLVEEELTSYLTTKGFSMALTQGEFKSEKTENCWDLFYRIIQLKFTYPQVESKGLFGKKLVTRESELNLSFRLMDKNSGKILWTKRKNHSASDVIPKKTISMLKNEQYPFLSPELPQGNTRKYIEPALVAAVVGGLVYLFFASR
jgi:hypothetical protein